MTEPTLESVGDSLQSSASRLAAWVRAEAAKADEHDRSVFGDIGAVPYEVRMAAIEARADVVRWTEVRKGRPHDEA